MMLSAFEELNLYVYHSLQGVVLDIVIWCLGPLVDESRPYGLLRQILAVGTAKLCRGWLRLCG
jgi:hypothetical protein